MRTTRVANADKEYTLQDVQINEDLKESSTDRAPLVVASPMPRYPWLDISSKRVKSMSQLSSPRQYDNHEGYDFISCHKPSSDQSQVNSRESASYPKQESHHLRPRTSISFVHKSRSQRTQGQMNMPQPEVALPYRILPVKLKQCWSQNPRVRFWSPSICEKSEDVTVCIPLSVI